MEDTESITVNTEMAYSVTVTDANNCQNDTSINLIINDLPIPTISGSPTYCPGSSTTLDAGNWEGYLWSTNDATQTVEISSEQLVGVTVTDDNGCEGETSLNITESAEITPTITGDTEFCDGGSTILDAGDNYVSYMWSNGDMTQTTEIFGEETVTVTVEDAAGCTGSASVMTTFADELSITISGDTEFCDGGSTILDAGDGYASYTWSNGDMTQTTEIFGEETVTVTVMDAAGCSGMASATTTFADELTVSIFGNPSFCTGGSTTLDAGAGYATYLWSNGDETQTTEADMAEVYSVTVTDAAGCSGVGSVPVSEENTLMPTILGDTEICENEQTTLSIDGAFATYAWSNMSDQSEITISQSNNYSVTVTDASGCIGEASAFVQVNPNPTPTISGSATFCLGGSSTLDAGDGYIDYNWSTMEVSQDITVNTPNTYSVTVTDVNNCTGEDMIEVMQTDTLAPVIGGDMSFCAGGQTELDAGSGFATYAWSNMEATQQITVTQAGQYTVTVSDGSGCSGSGMIMITENQNPTPTISGDENFCFGEETTLTVNEAFVNYSWSNMEQTPSITISQSNTYEVTVTDNNNCIGTANFTATEGNPVIVNITGDTEICDGESTTLTATGGFESYTWTGGFAGQTLEVSSANTYSVVATDANNCEGTADFEVNVLPAIPMTQLTPEICEGETFEVGNSSYNAEGIYLDTIPGANGCDSIIQTQLTVNQSITTTATATICNGESIFLGGAEQTESGEYEDIFTSFNTGCDSIVVTTLTVESCGFAVNVMGNNPNCASNFGSFTISASAGSAPYTYEWQLNGTNVTGSGTLDEGEETTVGNIPVGDFTITITDVNGNMVEDNFSINSPDAIELSINIDAQAPCAGVADGALSANVDGGTAPYNFDWNNGLSTEQTLTDIGAGDYELLVTDANGCTVSATESLTYQTNLEAAATPAGETCEGLNNGSISVDFAGNGEAPYLYSLDGENYFPLGNSIENLTAGTYNVFVQDAQGCIEEIPNITVEAAEELVLELPENYTIGLGDSVRLEPQLAANATAWQWTPADFVTCDTCQFTFASPLLTTTYEVIATLDADCFVTGNTTVIVENNRDVYIPNVFSPNNDGVNDVFMIYGGRDVAKVNAMQIYTRWGESVFELFNFQPNDIQSGWNGQHRGQRLNSGVYLYFFEVEFVDGSIATFTGDILLL